MICTLRTYCRFQIGSGTNWQSGNKAYSELRSFQENDRSETHFLQGMHYELLHSGHGPKPNRGQMVFRSRCVRPWHIRSHLVASGPLERGRAEWQGSAREIGRSRDPGATWRKWQSHGSRHRCILVLKAVWRTLRNPIRRRRQHCSSPAPEAAAKTIPIWRPR